MSVVLSSSAEDCIQGGGRLQPPTTNVYKSFPKLNSMDRLGRLRKGRITSEVITIIIIRFGELIGDAEVAADARINRRFVHWKAAPTLSAPWPRDKSPAP